MDFLLPDLMCIEHSEEKKIVDHKIWWKFYSIIKDERLVFSSVYMYIFDRKNSQHTCGCLSVCNVSLSVSCNSSSEINSWKVIEETGDQTKIYQGKVYSLHWIFAVNFRISDDY